jgi:hypothetical protein
MKEDPDAAEMLARADAALAETIRSAKVLEDDVWQSLGGGQLE